MSTRKPHLRAVPPPVAGRTPPSDLDAEGAVLSAVLLDRDALDRVIDTLAAEHFYSDVNGQVYTAARALAEAGHPIDIVTVASWLRDRELLAQVGGAQYLAQLTDLTPAVAHIEAHARIIVDKARQRRLIATCQVIAAEGYGDVGELGDWLDRSEQAVCDATRASDTSTMALAGVAVAEAFQRVQDALAAGQTAVGTPTGFDKLDGILGRLRPGAFHVVAARPGMGKTSLALCIGLNIAAGGVGCAVFSQEMVRDELAERMCASESRTSYERLRANAVLPNDWPALTEAAKFIQAVPLWLDDQSALKPIELRARVRRLIGEAERRSQPLKVVIVDYLQLMDASDTQRDSSTRNNEVSDITAALKRLAKDMRVTVIALSQLSRDVEKRNDKRPQLSDLRDSGSIEQDADAVWFLYRDEYYKGDRSDAKGLAEVIVAKNRHGRTGKALLRWSGYCVRFDNLAAADYPALEDDD